MVAKAAIAQFAGRKSSSAAKNTVFLMEKKQTAMN